MDKLLKEMQDFLKQIKAMQNETELVLKKIKQIEEGKAC